MYGVRNWQRAQESGRRSSSARGPRRNASAAPAPTSSAATPARSPCATAHWSAPSHATSSRRSNIPPGRNTAITGITPGSPTSWDRPTSAAYLQPTSGTAKTEVQLFHRQRYREATQAIGKIGSHVLDWAVCREIALEQVGYTLGWSSRAQAYAAAVERMKTALEAACKLWGIGS